MKCYLSRSLSALIIIIHYYTRVILGTGVQSCQKPTEKDKRKKCFLCWLCAGFAPSVKYPTPGVE